MEVIPALDLKGGRCVRLYQGDLGQEEVFSDDPLGVALRWQREGARWLHIVDLDGAAAGHPVHLEVVKGVAAALNIPVQLGGGIRSLEVARRALDFGVRRLVLGTSAVREPHLISQMVDLFGPEVVVVSVDARDGRVALQGWKEHSDISAKDLARAMAGLGVRRLIYTDIARDGTLTEPNFAAIDEMVAESGLPVIAAGGIASVEHLVRLAALGVEGAIVGRALYTGSIGLQEAIAAVAAPAF
ncbi:MAG: 1-(5-phosphoribosyl)-5-[(5-phosphoribosylamino)methylideneamino]imidazole-4-carboxamide isomerase [Chloroflexi bacterium]|nr:1-(5-phosphoribosyl)-5-[(5-phosphoribosylamino)methylideneamino]imidazole-4-carboxamide isomerase [Chloroflexota bacterium]